MRLIKFKYRMPRIIGVLIVVLFSAMKAYTIEPDLLFQKANELYKAKNYSNAAIQYEQLIKEKYMNAEIYYNLGNAYYKLDKNPLAILNYERALKLNPGDEDILFNLKIAQLKLIDKIDNVPEIFYVRWLHDLYMLFSTDTWATITSICIWLLFLFAALYIISNTIFLKRSGFILAIIFLFISGFTWFLGQLNYESTQVSKSGIVVAVSAYVKSSPGENNTDLFLLHEGAKIKVLDAYDNWLKISIANGSVGWLKKVDIAEI